MVGDARVGKVIHLVVQYYPRGWREYLVAKTRKEISQVTRTELSTDYRAPDHSLPARSWYNHYSQQINGAGHCDRVAVGTND